MQEDHSELLEWAEAEPRRERDKFIIREIYLDKTAKGLNDVKLFEIRLTLWQNKYLNLMRIFDIL